MELDPFDLDQMEHGGGGGHHHTAENPLWQVHRRLRGRYHWVVILAAGLAPVFAVAGWLAVKPQYQSTGIVRVAPTLPRLLYESEENQLPPLFDSYVAAQATYLSSRRVLDKAADPAFKPASLGDRSLTELGWPVGAGGIVQLRERLSVRLGGGRGSQLITVSVEHSDPAMAQHAVNAVLAAYETIYGEEGQVATTSRERILQDRAQRLDRELRTTLDSIWRITEKQGPETLDRLHEAKIREVERLDAQIGSIELMLVQARHTAEEGGAPTGASPTETLLARQDPALADLVAMRDQIEIELARLGARFGPAHPEMRRRSGDLSAIQGRIDARVAELQADGAAPAGAAAGDTTRLADMTAPQLERMLEQYRSIRGRVYSEAEQLGERRQTIVRLRDQETETRGLLDETRTALETIRVEEQASHTGRITIAQYGDRPLAPSTDRRIPLAAAGAMGGCGLAAGAVFLVGLLDRRYRYIDEISHRKKGPPQLGALPELARADEEQQELARFSVHQIRNVVTSAVRSRAGARVLCVTSPMSGDGKTSLTLALGMSFASGGDRTLVIDADLIGRGLTRSLTLSGKPGFREVLEGRELDDELLVGCFPGLEALPTGVVSDFEPERVSASRLEAMLDHLRSRYDTILIDTGPLLGSIEADLASSLSDSTLLVISRGQSQKSVNDCFKRLDETGRHCAGYVFNKANTTDFRRSSSTISQSRRSGTFISPAGAPARRSLMDAVAANMRLGRLLVRMGKLTQEQLDEALEIQSASGESLGRVLVEGGFVTDTDVEDALRSQRRFRPGAEENAA